MSYRQLTEGQRYQISILLAENISFRKIGDIIGVSVSTVSREIKRHCTAKQAYNPASAHAKALAVRHKKQPARIAKSTVYVVEMLLKLDWSPEQISGVCQRQQIPVSHEWIYQHIHADFKAGGRLYLHLRHRLKRYKKRFHKQRGRILDRRSIHERPPCVATRERYGDWEIDTVLGRQGTGVIVSALERKSLFYVTKKVESKQAEAVTKALISMLKPYQPLVHTITADNGLEFAHHKEVAKQLKADFYFADPYASYQRGANENANGLLRQYVPKGTNIRQLDPGDLASYQQRLNLRPRKTLGFMAPAFIFKQQLESIKGSVALGS